MDWNALYHFLVIADAGSLSSAAQKLGVNHSTVFRRLQAFEQELGGRLFERVDNRYLLTPLGEELLARASGIADTIDDIERNLIGKDFLPRGKVTITAPYNIAARFLPQALLPLRENYPDIELQVMSSNVEVNMNSRAADIALRATAKPPEHLVGRIVAQIPWGVFASQNYLERTGEVTLANLDSHALIGGAGDMMRLSTFTWLEKHHPTAITLRGDELSVMTHFCRSDFGVAFLPFDQPREGLIKICDFTPPGTASQLWLLTHPDLRKTERVRLVMQHISEYFLELDFK